MGENSDRRGYSVVVSPIVFVIFAFIKISELRRSQIHFSSNTRIAAPDRSYSLIILILILCVVAGVSSLSIIKSDRILIT